MQAIVNFFTFIFVGWTILSFTFEGGGGLLTTGLTSSLSTTATSMSVTSTTGFLTSDKLVIGKEEFFYTGKTPTTFTGLTRGYNDTDAAAHASGSAVYTKAASTLNQLAGFNVGETAGTIGTLQLIAAVPGAIVHAVAQITVGRYWFFTGSLIYLQYFFGAITGAFVIYFVFQVASFFGGLVRR